MSKKWRREVKQQIDNEKLFKRSKERKLDFSINESPTGSSHNFHSGGNDLNQSPSHKRASKIRNKLIQNDSDDEQIMEEQRQQKSDLDISNDDYGKTSYESDPLQKIIEQRMLESSTDSEESEEELEDDYDIGIDDIDLGTEDKDEIHTATEEEESNILNDSFESQQHVKMDYHKKRLKETLAKPRDTSPFMDVIERGVQNYMNIGGKREVRLKNTVVRRSTKKKNTAYDYTLNTNQANPRSISQVANRSTPKLGKNETRKKNMNALGLSESYDESPEAGSKVKPKKHESRLEAVRRDQVDLSMEKLL